MGPSTTGSDRLRGPGPEDRTATPARRGSGPPRHPLRRTPGLGSPRARAACAAAAGRAPRPYPSVVRRVQTAHQGLEPGDRGNSRSVPCLSARFGAPRRRGPTISRAGRGGRGASFTLGRARRAPGAASGRGCSNCRRPPRGTGRAPPRRADSPRPVPPRGSARARPDAFVPSLGAAARPASAQLGTPGPPRSVRVLGS